MKYFESKNGNRNYHIAHSFMKIFMTVLGIGVLLFGFDYFYSDGNKKDFNLVKDKLGKIENIKVLKLGFKDDAVVLTNIFATFNVSGKTIITVSDLRPDSFEKLGITTLLRVGEWGIASLKFSPHKEELEYRFVYKNGVRVNRDKQFFNVEENYSFKHLISLINNVDKLENYVLTLPILDQGIIDEEFFNKHAVLKEDEYGFGKNYYLLKWRFKTNYMGDSKKTFGNQTESMPVLSEELLNKFI